MKYLKYFKLFEDGASSFDSFIENIKKRAIEHGVKLILPDSDEVIYNGVAVSGYFIDNGDPTFACAIGGDIKRWGPIFAHESSHMDQWIENSEAWRNNYYKGKEAVEWLDEWCDGRVSLSDVEVNEIIDRAIGVELDCEKRTIEKERKYNLPVNIEEEIQKSISYILFYRFLQESRKWCLPGKAPHGIREVWTLMPTSFDDIDFKTVPDNIKEAYYKYCY